MARVRFLGWTGRNQSRRDHRIVTAGGATLKKSVHAPNGQRFVFRGRARKKSKWRTVEDREAVEYFEEHEDFEVQRS